MEPDVAAAPMGDDRGLLIVDQDLGRHAAEPLEGADQRVVGKLLVGRLRLTPKITEGGRWYEFSGKVSYGALLSGIVGMVPPG